MHRLLFVLLVLSLVANVWFVFAARPVPAPAERLSAPDSPPTSARALVPAAAAPSADAVPTTHGLLWRPPVSDTDFRQLALDLKAAGVPARLVYQVMCDLLRQHLANTVPGHERPYWQRLTFQYATAHQQHFRNYSQRIDDLFGDLGRPSELLDAMSRHRAYGHLDNDKLDALLRLERDYRDVRLDTMTRPGPLGPTEPPGRLRSAIEQGNLIAREQRTDLERLLSPEELAAHDQRHSPSARRLGNTLATVEVSADEYARLYALRRTYDAAADALNPSSSGPDAARRTAAQRAFIEQSMAILGPERSASVLELLAEERSFRATLESLDASTSNPPRR